MRWGSEDLGKGWADFQLDSTDASFSTFISSSEPTNCMWKKTRACNKNAKSFPENLRRNLNVPMPIAWRFSKVLINGRRQVPNRDHRVDNGEIEFVCLLHWDTRKLCPAFFIIISSRKSMFIASPVLRCWLLLHALFPSLRAKSELHQDEERSKVIDDVLVILQTLLKRTDTLQTLAISEYFGIFWRYLQDNWWKRQLRFVVLKF